MLRIKIGEWFRKRRQEVGLSLRAVASKILIDGKPISPTVISDIERGICWFSERIYAQFCRALNTPEDEVFAMMGKLPIYIEDEITNNDDLMILLKELVSARDKQQLVELMRKIVVAAKYAGISVQELENKLNK